MSKVFAPGALVSLMLVPGRFKTDGAYWAVVYGVVRHPGPLAMHSDK